MASDYEAGQAWADREYARWLADPVGLPVVGSSATAWPVEYRAAATVLATAKEARKRRGSAPATADYWRGAINRAG